MTTLERLCLNARTDSVLHFANHMERVITNADGHSQNGKDECRAKDPSKCRVHGHVGSELSKGIEDRMKGREFGLARHALTDLRWSEGVESAILGKERLGKDGKKVNRKDFATWDVELKMKDGGKCSVQLYNLSFPRPLT